MTIYRTVAQSELESLLGSTESAEYVALLQAYNGHCCNTTICCRLIKQHRESLENDIYAEGIEHVRRLLCSDFSKLCPMHTLYDSGEL